MTDYEAYANECNIKNYLLNFNGKITLNDCSSNAQSLIEDCDYEVDLC